MIDATRKLRKSPAVKAVEPLPPILRTQLPKVPRLQPKEQSSAGRGRCKTRAAAPSSTKERSTSSSRSESSTATASSSRSSLSSSSSSAGRSPRLVLAPISGAAEAKKDPFHGIPPTPEFRYCRSSHHSRGAERRYAAHARDDWDKAVRLTTTRVHNSH